MSSARGGFYLKDSDIDLIRWLADYRYLQPSHLQKLTCRHVVSLRRRLRQLLERRLVDRFTLPLSRSRPVNSPPDEYVYRLSRKGIEVASQELGIEGLIYTDEKRVTFLEHDLAISSFHLELEVAAWVSGGRLTLQWKQAGLQDWAVGPAGERLSVNPDALFGISDGTRPVDSNTEYFFLEVERSRQHSYENGESALFRKLRAYDAYARQDRHSETWGFDAFRVVVIVPTEGRAQNVVHKLKEARLASERFVITRTGDPWGSLGVLAYLTTRHGGASSISS